MNKVLKKVGLSAVVATFVFGLAGTSSALVAQDPDNETANISATADVYVFPDAHASYSETEKYNVVVDNASRDSKQGKTGLTYDKNFNATNGEIHVTSSFKAVGNADPTTPNIAAQNKVVFNSAYAGLNGGTFTGTERIAYQRCQPQGKANVTAFCTENNVSTTYPAAYGDVAAGSTFDVSYASVTTGADVSAVSDSTKVIPSLNYNIAAAGVQPGQLASGSVSAGMKANVVEYLDNNKDKKTATTTMSYEQHTAASGLITFSKDMKYNSALKNSSAATPNINSVP